MPSSSKCVHHFLLTSAERNRVFYNWRGTVETQRRITWADPHLHNIKHIICISLLISSFAAELVPLLQGIFPSLLRCMLSLDLDLIKCAKTQVYFSTHFIRLAMQSVFPPNWKLFQYCILLQKHFKQFVFFISTAANKPSIICLCKRYHLQNTQIRGYETSGYKLIQS